MCHVDKRPDVGLHRELARAGVLLGYDTFGRPKYNPDQGVWQLIPALVAGNSVVFKILPEAPLLPSVFADVIGDFVAVGWIPEGVVSFLWYRVFKGQENSR
jgi:hypothetical protein